MPRLAHAIGPRATLHPRRTHHRHQPPLARASTSTTCHTVPVTHVTSGMGQPQPEGLQQMQQRWALGLAPFCISLCSYSHHSTITMLHPLGPPPLTCAEVWLLQPDSRRRPHLSAVSCWHRRPMVAGRRAMCPLRNLPYQTMMWRHLTS